MEIFQMSHYVEAIMKEHTGRKWKIDGRLAEPTPDDIEKLIDAMVKDIKKHGYDSIESGGILIKRDRDKIDLYVHIGELHEDISL